MFSTPPASPFESPAVAEMRQHRLRQALALTMEQRLIVANQLYASAIHSLQGNPQGLQPFVIRNHRKRRLSQVRELEQQMRVPHIESAFRSVSSRSGNLPQLPAPLPPRRQS